jgi:hypothetical protein
MARKIIDTYPVFTVTVGAVGRPFERRSMGAEEAQAAADEFSELLRDLKAQTRRQYDVECRIVSEAVCEHCRHAWTETSTDYNGGCCGKDEANNPERLKALAALAEAVSDGCFYRWDADLGRSRVAVNWPDQLGCAAALWLENGRPANDVPRLLALAKHVQASEWCTVESDPGPSGCSLPRQADRVLRDERPEELAGELCSLLDDMGLLPATAGVA